MPEITPNPVALPLSTVVREHILSVCERCGWSLSVAAVLLDVATKTLYNHLNRYQDEGVIRKRATGKGWERTEQQAEKGEAA